MDTRITSHHAHRWIEAQSSSSWWVLSSTEHDFGEAIDMSDQRVTAARRFFEEAIRDHGIREGDQVRIPMRQCELARRRDVAPSTVGAYLTAMGSAVVARHPEIVLMSGPSSARSSQPAAAAGDVPSELVSALVAVVEAQNQLLGCLARMLEPARPRAVLRDERPIPRDLDILGEQGGEENTFLPPATRANRATRAESPRGYARLDELLMPLHQFCERTRLTPLNNRLGVADALSALEDADVEELVRGVIRDAQGRVEVHSPFGLLVSRARRYEPPSGNATAPAPPPTGLPEPIDIEVDVDVDDGLADRIARYEADPDCTELLKALDDEIKRELPTLMRREVAPAVLRALRADVLRRQVSGSGAGT